MGLTKRESDGTRYGGTECGDGGAQLERAASVPPGGDGTFPSPYGHASGESRVWFDALYRRHYVGVSRLALRYLDSREAAEDIAQDVFVAVWETRERWAAIGAALPAVLYRAARNRALNVIKRERTHACCSLDALDSDDSVAAWEPERADARALQEELQVATQRAVGRLPARRHLIFSLSREQGLSHGEIALRLGVSPRTVETQIARALKSIRIALLRHL